MIGAYYTVDEYIAIENKNKIMRPKQLNAIESMPLELLMDERKDKKIKPENIIKQILLHLNFID